MNTQNMENINKFAKIATVDEQSAKKFADTLQSSFGLMIKLQNTPTADLMKTISQVSANFNYKEIEEMDRDCFVSDNHYQVYTDANMIIEGMQLALDSYKYKNMIDFMLAMHVVKDQFKLLQESIQQCLKTDGVEE